MIDDLGLYPGVLGAALRLVELDRVQALGCMVGGPAWPAAVGPLRALAAAEVDVGLHLDLTECRALPGIGPSLRRLIAASQLRRLDPAALRSEIDHQLDAFAQTLGREPAFVDGHQHVHQLPGVREALVERLDARRGRGPRPWLRCTRSASDAGATVAQRFKSAVIEGLGAHGLTRLARARGYGQNARLLGVYDFDGSAAAYRDRLAGWLAAARHGDLLMCHPSLDVEPGDPIGPARRAEFDVLSGPDLPALLDRLRLRLAPMSRILADAGERTGPRPPSPE